MRFFVLAVAMSAAAALRLRGDTGCSSSDGTSCISPMTVEKPTSLNPATVATSTNANGFVSAEALAGDMPGDDPGPPESDEEEDMAAMFLVESPQLQMPPTPPPLITCDYDKCTTTLDPNAPSTTTEAALR